MAVVKQIGSERRRLTKDIRDMLEKEVADTNSRVAGRGKKTGNRERREGSIKDR